MKLAAYQFSVCGDIQHNLSVIKNAVHEAAGKAVDLIVFPECALTGYPPRDIDKSANIDTNAVSEALKELQKTADTSNIHIMLGTIACSDSGYYNRAYLLSPGQPPRWYGKRALYGWDEENFRPGAVCSELEKDREGMLIYDFEKQSLTFGELGRRRYSDLLLHAEKKESP